MQQTRDLMTKMGQLLDLVPEETVVESLNQNKGLVDEICAISEQSEAYEVSASDRDEFIMAIMDKYGDKDDCLVYAWYHSLNKIATAPTALLPTVVMMTMPLVKYFLNN